MSSRYSVRLTADERHALTVLTRRGQTSARRLVRARALLLSDGGATDGAIADALGLCARSVARLRQRAVEEGALLALDDRPRPGAAPCLDERQEAYLVALACSTPPAGRATWSLQLLAERMVALEVVASLSADTVGRRLKKMTSSPGSSSNGASRR
jgi:putative transposase